MKIPTRSVTHEEVDPARLASMGLELEDIADGETIALPDLIELAEDRGRPASHYLAAIPLATELKLAGDAALTVKVCADRLATPSSASPVSKPVVSACTPTDTWV